MYRGRHDDHKRPRGYITGDVGEASTKNVHYSIRVGPTEHDSPVALRGALYPGLAI